MCRVDTRLWLFGNKPWPAAVVLLAVTLGSACGSDVVDDGPASFVQRDSAGVLISITPGPEAHALLPWQIDSVPNVVIGAGNSPATTLYRVQGLKGLPDGRILVVDGSSAELRFYDTNGQLLQRVGGKGAGPGEFQDPVLVPRPDRRELLLFDEGLPRLQVFSLDGTHESTRRYVAGWPQGNRRAPMGAIGSQALFQSIDAEAFVAQLRKQLEGDGVLLQMELGYYWYDITTAEEVPLNSSTFTTDETYTVGGHGEAIPFALRPSAAVTEDGALITDGRAYEIRAYDTQGRLSRIYRIDQPGQPVTEEILDAKIELEAAAREDRSTQDIEMVYDEVPIPDTLPVFESLQVDEPGWIWAELYRWRPEEARTWMVFDTAGRAHGVIRTPAGLEIGYIGRDYILGVWRDELDIEYVSRYSLRRSDS